MHIMQPPRNRGQLVENNWHLYWNAIFLLESVERQLAQPHCYPLFEGQYTALQAHIRALKRLRGGGEFSPYHRPIRWP